MWDKWKDQKENTGNGRGTATPTQPQPQYTPAPSVEQPAYERRAAAPAAAAPTVRETESSRSSTLIGPSMIVKGQISSQEDLRIEGSVEGTLEVLDHRILLGVNGTIRSDIKAREVVVQGKIRGNVDASDKIAIGKAGELIGDIRTAGITIEDGGYFKGSVDIVRKAPTA